MEERLKCMALVGGGALLGSVSTLFLLKLLRRKLESQCSSVKAIEFDGKEFKAAPTIKNCKVVEDRDGGMDGQDLLKDEIVSEQLTRNIQFFGLEFQQKVTASYVVIIGLGGVGSHAASMLLRSGVGRLLLVDFDQVSLSSLNRHAVATREDVGIPKAQCLKKHFSAIFPECQIDARVLLYDASSEEDILSGHPDFVLDCIDNIDTKVALLAACVRRGLKVLSATGAGARADPTRIRVADLRESTNDPLSRSVRHRLRKDYGIEGGIPVVFSLEKPKVKLLPFKGSNGEEENPSDYQVDVAEVMYIVKDLWRGRSAREQSIEHVGRGMWRSVNELMLVRWDQRKPASVSNLILLKFKEADEHESRTLDDIKEKEPEYFNRVTSVLKRAELDFGL
ncbi:tRNA threonylcarbamoyladenosine dehydratase isoform X4 [Vitis vinifera]|uniref:tRNA threonylcarbamoyladenosine dehydratase isoform X4 n=1 Tax=Vitis vinifera TaxID=29760 RepID=UPI0008FF8F50|nr:tRNA threonylcarbamoyladenosine dehydratase isoform X4 [Vitis vinifera]|eukprot:XP_019077917.1 PREDICTED: tRNA threonylcarbamoyladenosine dehydratase isoform X3 [Vitis vinifera]